MDPRLLERLREITPEEREGMRSVLSKVRRNLDEAMACHECQASQTEEKA